MTRPSAPPFGPVPTALALLLLALLALVLRSYQLPWIFAPDGSVLIEPYDGSYHARLAFYSFARFPRALFFDPQISYPDGAVVPLPLLYDWLLGGVARLFGDTQAVFERVAAWSSPVLAALTALPVFLAGRAMAGPRTGLGAAALFALSPVHATFSRLGNPDHHAAVALLGAIFLALSVSELVREPRRRGLRILGLGLVRAGIVLSWTGSLLYLALGDGALMLAAVVTGRSRRLGAQAASALLSAALVAPWAAALPEPVGGYLSSTSFSWLSVVALLGIAGVAGALAALERRRPARSPLRGLLRLALVGGGSALAVLLALGGVLAPAAEFLGKADSWVEGVPEQQALFAWLGGEGGSVDSALDLYGFLAFLIPLAPLAALWCARDPALRGAGICLAVWVAGLGALATLQMRFGCDFAPSASVAFALGIARVGGLLRPGAPRAIACMALGGLLLAPVLQLHGRNLQLAWLQGRARNPDFDHPYRPLLDFARQLREATPETSGFLDPEATPEYGVLARPSYGHVLSYAARRATPTSNLGPYLDPVKMERVQDFLAQRDEGRALEIAERLRGRYVMVSPTEVTGPGQLEHHLYFHDGAERAGLPALGRFRLVTEGPGPASAARPPRFKLFEIVPGAELLVPGQPDERVLATLRLRSPAGRSFAYRSSARVGEDGLARLRVPYPGGGATGSPGPWRIRIADRELRVPVSEADVRDGRTLRLSAP